MKTVNIEANPKVTPTILPTIEFKAPNNDDYVDHEEVIINYINNDGEVFASENRRVIRIIDAENGSRAWFEAYLGTPAKRD